MNVIIHEMYSQKDAMKIVWVKNILSIHDRNRTYSYWNFQSALKLTSGLTKRYNST